MLNQTIVKPATKDEVLDALLKESIDIRQERYRYRVALEQIKLYHENMHGAKAKDFIAYDIACKALVPV